MCRACDYDSILKTAGLRRTRARLGVLALLGESTVPLTAAQLRTTSPEPIDRVTVYRVLEAFEEAGLVNGLNVGGRAKRYHLTVEPNHPSHAHFLCTGCGRLTCLHDDQLSLRLDTSFPAKVQAQRIAIEGICPECLADNR